jgi:hypothetical protein
MSRWRSMVAVKEASVSLSFGSLSTLTTMDSPAAPPAEPTEYDPKTIRIFVQTVSRAFYESSAIILLDTLLRKPA